MYNTQQILIKKGHRMYGYFDEMCINAKNMFNTTNFYIRQVYTALTSSKPLQPLQKEVLDTIHQSIQPINDKQRLAYEKKVAKQAEKPVEDRKEVKLNEFDVPHQENPYVNYNFLDALFKHTKQADYRSLPAQSSQQVMKSVFECWTSFYHSLRDYKENPHKYTGRPNIPKYSRSQVKEVTFTNQDCVIKDEKYLKFPKTKLRLNIGKLGCVGKLQEVRVIPKYQGYVVELVFTQEEYDAVERPTFKRIAAIDLGINNIATIVTNTGCNPYVVKGKHIKSINQWYNKKRAHFLGVLRHGKNEKQGPFTSKRLEKLSEKRFLKIKDAFHKVSAQVINIATSEEIDTIVIGQNKGWKQEVDIGKRNNQSFMNIPHSLLIKMIKYKAELVGIHVETTEESYTSRASFIDDDAIPTYSQEKRGSHSFSGTRVKRGLFQSKFGWLINADVNGAANILKKAFLTHSEEDSFNIETVNVWDPACV